MREKTSRGRALLCRFAHWLADDRGNVGPLLAIMIVPIIGAFAIGGEATSWYWMHRGQQNAADSAVLAAALDGGANTYADQARAVASKYGFVDNTNGVAVIASSPACPTGASVIANTSCYRVEVDKSAPIYLSRAVGYHGDAVLNGAPAKLIKAKSVAGWVTGTNNFCMIGLNQLTLAGGNGTDLTGCQLLSGAGGMNCAGNHSADGVQYAYTAGNFSGYSCGTSSTPGYNFSGDPEQSTIKQFTKNTNCSSTTTASTGSFITVNSVSSGVNCFVGPVQLGSDITITNPNTVLVFKANASQSGGNPTSNAGLDLHGHSLSTASGASATIVYAGPTTFNKNANPLFTSVTTGNPTLNISAPTSGNWKGIVIAEEPADPNAPTTDPGLTGTQQGSNNSIDITLSGNSPTMDLTGLIYAHSATVTITGSINHAQYSDQGAGYACIGILGNTVKTAGTNGIFANPTSQCRQAGLTLPTVPMVALLR